MMRALLALVAGSGDRIATSALAIVALTFMASGHGWGLLAAAMHGALFASGFLIVGLSLGLAADAAGVADDDRPAPATAPARKPAGTDPTL